MGNAENEIKKEYLRRYRGHVQRIQRIEAELSELRAMKVSVSVHNDGMPRGSGQSDLSGYAAELDQAERRLIEERRCRVNTYKDISARIKDLSSEDESNVLFYRYIKGFAWWEIAEKLGFSERQVYRYHGKALAHISIPEKS